MLSILAISATFLCVSVDASAQDTARRGGGMGGQRRSPEERAKMQTEQMKTEFSLTGDQVTKVDSINLKFAKEQQGGMRGGGPGGQGGQGGADMETRMAAMKKVQDDKNTAFKTVLTDKQYTAYLKWVEDQRQKMMERMQQRNGN